MKTLSKLLFFLLAISFYSCNKEDITTNEDENNFQNNNRSSTSFNQGDFFSANIDASVNQKQWVAYLIAQAILNDNNAEEEFFEVSNQFPTNTTGILDFETLYRINNAEGNTFLNAFKTEFLFYYNYNCDVNGGGKPSGRPTPPNSPDDDLGPSSNDELFDSYINQIRNYDLDIYLPNDYRSNTEIAIYPTQLFSTANSLNDGYGYKHINRCIVFYERINEDTKGNIIIVR